MTIVLSTAFASGHRALPKETLARADEAIRPLAANAGGRLFHPSFRTKRVRGILDVREASVTVNYRLTSQTHNDTMYLRVIGDHDATLKRP